MSVLSLKADMLIGSIDVRKCRHDTRPIGPDPWWPIQLRIEFHAAVMASESEETSVITLFPGGRRKDYSPSRIGRPVGPKLEQQPSGPFSTRSVAIHAAVERAEHRLKLAKKKVAEFYRDHDPKDPRNGHANRYCAEIFRDAETELNWARHKLVKTADCLLTSQ